MARNRKQAAIVLTPLQAADLLLQAVRDATAPALKELVQGLDDHALLAEVVRRCEDDPNGFPGILWTDISEHIGETELDEEQLRERCEEAGIELRSAEDFEIEDRDGELLALVVRTIYSPWTTCCDGFIELKRYLQAEFNIHSG